MTTPRVLFFVRQTSCFTQLVSFQKRSIFLLLTMPTPCEKEIERLLKLLAEFETLQASDLDFEHNGPEDVLEDNISDHE
ncbi:hypothetical protein AVEN_90578-1 [Araneus ventricosus]|uniref:Uncharacterized protein n=1 Tax=Araneus ventricosus TaxID=182803 RepID=A0A4Y2Q4M1_ARAVE|nr:hypothetical protein AVEN_249510-1 [Araneus ventricosus]GBN58172.1 hypothetical protein AVEN_90578-1 [Araneus ventricosus]